MPTGTIKIFTTSKKHTLPKNYQAKYQAISIKLSSEYQAKVSS